MYHLVLTGQIGAGKTSVASALEAELNTRHISLCALDYDTLTHEILTSDYGVTNPAERAEFASKLFADDTFRTQFEAEIHPKVYELAARKLDKIGGEPLVVHQIPLYFETEQLFVLHFGEPDAVVALTVSESEQLRRLQESRAYSVSKVEAIRAAQHSSDELARGGVSLAVDTTHLTPAAVAEQVVALLQP